MKMWAQPSMREQEKDEDPVIGMDVMSVEFGKVSRPRTQTLACVTGSFKIGRVIDIERLWRMKFGWESLYLIRRNGYILTQGHSKGKWEAKYGEYGKILRTACYTNPTVKRRGQPNE